MSHPDRLPLRLEYVDPASIVGNPLNWRVHGEAQRGAIAESLERFGWVKPLVYNGATSRLVDGHARLELARAQGMAAVPVVIGHWSDAQERSILATLDPIGLMADGDPIAFRALLDQLDTTGEELQSLLSATAEGLGLFDAIKEEAAEYETLPSEPLEGEPAGPPEPVGPIEVLDVLFPSSNPWGVPDLLPHLAAEAVVFPVTAWGSVGAKHPMTGTWACYVDDQRFEPLWKDPSRLLLSGPAAVVEPNFSTHDQHPRAFTLWQVYRKRWLARWWQSKGLRVFVDLNVDREARDLNLLGVPRGWKAYANRAHNGGDGLEEECELAREHAGTAEILYLVYGGGKAVKALAEARGWNWVPEQFDAAHARLKAKGATDGQG